MPESACLHIQARDADPIRVVEIPGTSVRIGRASYCEVRLPEPEVADEECLLRRRGGTWHLVPIGRTGLVTMDDRPVERPRPIPFGVPFRVGDHRLTLQATSDGPGRWGSFHRPIPLELPAVEATPRDEPPRTEPATEPDSGPAGFEDEQERLARWQERHEQRGSWLRARQEERRWEERWKAAGERLRARSATAPPRPTPSTVSRAHEGVERIASTPREGVRVRKMTRRPVPVTPPSTGDGLPPLAPEPVVPPPSPSATRARDLVRLGRDPDPRPRRTPPGPRQSPEGTGTHAEGRAGGGRSRGADRDSPGRPRAAHHPGWSNLRRAGCAGHVRNGRHSRPYPGGRTFSSNHPRSTRPRVPGDGRARTDPRALRGVHRGGPGGLGRSGRFHRRYESAGDRDRSRRRRGGRRNPGRPRPGAGRARRGAARAAAPGPGSRRTDTPKSVRTATLLSPPVPLPGPSGAARDESRAASREWPTAREIFAAHRARRETPTAPAPARSLPLPTVSREPASWALPLWLGWPLAMLSSVGVGGMVLSLAVAWSQDDQAAGLVANHLARGKATGKPLPETLVPPAHPSWWNTTSGNLGRWALERARAPREPGLAEEVRALLDAATSIAPLDAVARLALARSGTGDEGAAPLDRSLGLSRDVVALAWSGRQLLAAGKKAAALKAYREALEMACRAELSRLASPEFLDDSPTRRYALPYEDLLGVVIRDLVERPDWQFADWSEALPRFGVAPLVAARLLRERSGLDADAALDVVLADGEAPLPEGLPVAAHLAAQGEALALKARWSEAEERYRKAIDLMPDDRVRRSWSFNLADLARRLGDEPKRLKALEMARGADSKDEITRRAFEAIRETGARSLTAGAPTRDATGPIRSR